MSASIKMLIRNFSPFGLKLKSAIKIGIGFGLVLFFVMPAFGADNEAISTEATTSAPLRNHPIIGGHFGAGIMLFTTGTQPTTLIGRDVLNLGPVVGVNFGLDEHWSIDLETAALYLNGFRMIKLQAQPFFCLTQVLSTTGDQYPLDCV